MLARYYIMKKHNHNFDDGLHGCFKILMMDCMDVLKCIVGDYANRH
jgi:hypothetical protein